MATETQLITKLGTLYTVVGSSITTIETLADLALVKRTVKVLKTDSEGKVPIGEIMFLEWYTYNLGIAGEAIYLTKKSGVEVVEDILARAT